MGDMTARCKHESFGLGQRLHQVRERLRIEGLIAASPDHKRGNAQVLEFRLQVADRAR